MRLVVVELVAMECRVGRCPNSCWLENPYPSQLEQRIGRCPSPEIRRPRGVELAGGRDADAGRLRGRRPDLDGAGNGRGGHAGLLELGRCVESVMWS